MVGSRQIYVDRNISARIAVDGRRRDQTMAADLGARIRHMRLDAGLTERQLADKIGVSYQQLYKYELGENAVPTDRLWAVCDALGVELETLLPRPGGARVNLPRTRAPSQQLLRDFEELSSADKRVVSDVIRHLARRASAKKPSLSTSFRRTSPSPKRTSGSDE